MEADWDLLAVVRSCTSTTTTTTSSAASWPPPELRQDPPPAPPKPAPEASHGGCLASGCENLQDLYKPFFPSMSYPITAPGFFKEQEKQHQTPQPQPQQRQQMQQPQQILFQQHPQHVQESQVVFGSGGSGSTGGNSIISVGSIITSQSQRSSILCAPTASTSTTSQSHQRAKKRKNLQKRVCHVPAEGLSSDMWAWRKYGQKPIKGSPYPRGYYRCSSSKGCMARKQVERNRSDPKMFIVTYTAEHNHPMPTHRNSLAGSTRQKPSTSSGETAANPTAAAAASTPSPSINSTGNDHPGSSSPTASPMTDKAEVKAEYEDEMGKDDSGNEMDFPDMVLNDDFFVGFEELDDTDSGEAFSDQVVGSMEMEYPWLCNSSSSTTTAAGGS